MKTRLTPNAERDVQSILRATKRLFGPYQLVRYRDIINVGIGMVAGSPYRPTSRDQSEINPGVRSFHLQTATGRRKGAAHVLFYRIGKSKSGADELVILRILADEMDPRGRVIRALRSDPSKDTPEE